jgi:Arf-GAP/Rho-GAP domain/ANK repeat/PH domain-containing protein 3
MVEDQLATSSGALFTCPEEGCIKTFMNHHSMMQHLDCGKHQLKLERETIFDKAAQEYAEQLEGQATFLPQVGSAASNITTSTTSRQPMGWALKCSAGRARFTEAQKQYLTAKFKIGEQTGIKLDPAAVARSMMSAKGPDDKLLFTSEDFLTAKQISGFFSRLASKKSLQEIDLIHDVEAAAREADLEALLKDAEHNITQKHPIVYDSYNLCELAEKKKLDKFCLSILVTICSHFGIDTSDVKSKHLKKPYISKLTSFCEECECQQ